MTQTDEPVRDALAALEVLLERRARDSCDEVSHYPTPIARCDVQLTRAIEQRDHYLARLRVLRAGDVASLIAGRSWPQDEDERMLVAQLEAALGIEETRTISLGTRRLAVTTSGHGSPVIVLETGLGAESAEWGDVQRALCAHGRVCRYDRAGRGASDAAVLPRRPADLVADLHTLLHRAALTPPYVLVGHSFGGLLARLFAQRHRAEVAGLVLVDAMHQDQFDGVRQGLSAAERRRADDVARHARVLVGWLARPAIDARRDRSRRRLHRSARGDLARRSADPGAERRHLPQSAAGSRGAAPSAAGSVGRIAADLPRAFVADDADPRRNQRPLHAARGAASGRRGRPRGARAGAASDGHFIEHACT